MLNPASRSPWPRAALLLACLLGSSTLLTPTAADAHAGVFTSPDLVVAYKIRKGRVSLGVNLPGAVVTSLLQAARVELNADQVPEAEAQRAVHKALFDAFTSQNPVRINGQAITPQSGLMTLGLPLPHARLEEVEAAVEGLELHASPWLSVQLVVDYPLPEGIKEVDRLALAWTLDAAWPTARTTPRGRRIEDPGIAATLFPADTGQPVPFTFTRTEPGFTWHAPPPRVKPPEAPTPAPTPTLPGGSLAAGLLGVLGALLFWRRKQGLVAILALALSGGGAWAARSLWPVEAPWGAGGLAPEQALKIFRDLHAGLYAAFDQQGEEATYDALAQHIDGPLLDFVYTEVYGSLILREEGGALSTIKAVQIEAADWLPDQSGADQFGVRARWTVIGEVAHFGHTHRRTNRYDAVYTVAQRPSGWRIVHTEVKDHSRQNTELPGQLGEPEAPR